MKTKKLGWGEDPSQEEVEAAVGVWKSSPELLAKVREAQAKTREKLRGGARAGAGRKALGKVQMLVKITPETRETLQRFKERTKQSQGDLVEAALREYFASHS